MSNIFNGNWGGLSDSKFAGILGSFFRAVGIDAHSEPGILKVRQALAKESGATVTGLCKVRLAVSSGESFWFDSTSGKIWRRSSAGVYLLVHTTVATGTDGCLGAEEHDGYIYWATAGYLHRIPITNIATLAHWTANAVHDWGEFTNKDASFHPMVKQNLQLFIGDANYIAKVSGDTGAHAFTANALDLKQPYRVKTMITFDIDILIGTFIDDNVNKTEILRWDTESESWLTSDPIEENGINAFMRDDNFVYAQAGQAGRWYFYNGQQLIPDTRIPGDWSPTKTAYVHPQAVATHLTIPVFGLSNITGNPALQGVYSLGSYSKNYQKVLDLSYPISAGLSGVEIGAVLAVGEDLLVSWKFGDTYGVDKLNWSAKYASAYLETMILTPAEARNFLKTTEELLANYASLPANTGIGFKYKKKFEVAYSAAMTVIDDTNLMQIRVKNGTIPDIASLQIRIDLTVSGNNAPEIESIYFSDNTSQ